MESKERLEKARLMQERMVEAQRVIDLLAESSHGKVGTTEETLHVCSRLIEEAWEASDELFPSAHELSRWAGDHTVNGEERPAIKAINAKSELQNEFYADDLADQIALGYSAVADTLKRIHKEEDSELQANLADVAMVLYKNAAVRTRQIISELEKETGKIQVLVDISKGYGGYDCPVMGFVIQPKQEGGHA